MNVYEPPYGVASPSMKWYTGDAPEHIRRLILLLPNADINEALLARALWTVAAPNSAKVHIVAMVGDWADEPQVRLRIALLSALLCESGLEPSTQFEISDTDWIRIARQVYVPGDTIVCHAEQKMPTGTRNFVVEFRPLSHFLAALRMPVCELQGVIRREPEMTLTRAMKVWVLPLLIVAGSLVLQLLFERWTHEWAAWVRQAALAIYTVIEVVLIARLARS